MTALQRWRDDAVAGLTGAVAGAPQAMGFALIAGMNPIYGLYTAVVAPLVAAFAGSSVFMTVGPTNALSLVVASTLLGISGDLRVESLFVLTLLTGVFYTLFGVLRLGFLVRFVSNAVMTGFITGAGMLIIFGQVRHLNGYDPEGGTTFLRFLDWVLNLHQSDPATSAVGAGALLTIWLITRTRFRNYAVLFAIAAASVVVLGYGLDSVALVRDVSAVPRGLPGLVIPDLTLFPAYVTAALAMAVLGTVQSAAITNGIPQPDGTRSNISRDLIGMGAGNLIGGFLQGMPACGSLSRTAVNVKSGARTRWANAFSGVFVGIFLIALGAAVERITLAALAAQLIFAAASLIRPRELMMVWRVNWPARAAMAATFVSTMVLPLEYSIYVGVGLSLVLYIYTSSERVRAVRLIPTGDGHFRVGEVPTVFPAHQTVIISLEGPMYFAAIRRLEGLLPDPKKSDHVVLILRMRGTEHIGSTGIHLLEKYDRELRTRGGRLVLTGIGRELRAELERTGFAAELGNENLYDADEVLFAATTRAYERAREL
jgi:SulP family sulfate permease